MKQKELFCGLCRKYTPHRIYKNFTVAERIIGALFTFGLNEVMVETTYECLVCRYYWIE